MTWCDMYKWVLLLFLRKGRWLAKKMYQALEIREMNSPTRTCLDLKSVWWYREKFHDVLPRRKRFRIAIFQAVGS